MIQKKKKKRRNPDLFTESSDSEIEIARVATAGKPNNNNPTEINIKQKDVSEIQITKVIPANEQNNNSLTSGTRTLIKIKPDASHRTSGKIYISEN